ncbi:MAG TPA: integration host factor subunit alpha [Deltaproteobacteria bacterium]|jgi:integration host factor subunit alpha|nr:integration host factor subunit alpha [Deltaproteobacteria bacterium]HQI00163.1 integration host factor subunit alpha [Deltaproteobacteria bacterium]HQJ07453.1 integration host factor subunit alpha [Deltaproteobacteria bacterium]
MDTLTKKDIIEDLIMNLGLSRKEASDVIETFLEIIKENLEKGEEVSLSGFGKWSVRDKRERKGRNPKTGEKIAITERRVVTFSLSNVLRAKLEGKK